ncbi:hypothetical protein Agub_g6400 [Astrephomene gubernaculifera]|uniref:Uncharacterized protein n=1 Tax=Astrephomene gubernaculifera TaxID=47775 RepID=A0AAD3HLE3_9CHLO|nr:hypothetical protein Agub_g6400 [Astrephomene gubernaculifera]
MAHMAMVGAWPQANRLPPSTACKSLASPPRMVHTCSTSTPSGLAIGCHRLQGLPAGNLPFQRPLRSFGSQRHAPRRDLRSVSTNLAQTRHFNTNFDPSKSNIPKEYNFVQPLSAGVVTPSEGDGTPLGVLDVGPYVEFDPAKEDIPKNYWRGPAPAGSFTIGNKYAQRTRLTPLRVPELGATGPRNPLERILSPFPKEEYYAVEMDLNYGREWPRLVWEEGRPVLRPGFLAPSLDPAFPAYWLHRGIARFQLGTADGVLQFIVGAAYLATLALLAAGLYTVRPALLAAVAVSWARNSLSLAKWALLAVLTATDRLYLYWVFLAGKIVDGVFERHIPEVRNFCWACFALWGVYLGLSPASWPLLPGITL